MGKRTNREASVASERAKLEQMLPRLIDGPLLVELNSMNGRWVPDPEVDMVWGYETDRGIAVIVYLDEEDFEVADWTYTASKRAAKDEDPCWDGYEMVGMKDKNGKQVPNCVPTTTSSKRKMSKFVRGLFN